MKQPFQDVTIVGTPWRSEIPAEQRSNLQRPAIEVERLFLPSGNIRLMLGDDVFDWRPDGAVDIPTGMVHRIEAVADRVALEVSRPQLDDVVRVNDDYGRVV